MVQASLLDTALYTLSAKGSPASQHQNRLQYLQSFFPTTSAASFSLRCCHKLVLEYKELVLECKLGSKQLLASILNKWSDEGKGTTFIQLKAQDTKSPRFAPYWRSITAAIFFLPRLGLLPATYALCSVCIASVVRGANSSIRVLTASASCNKQGIICCHSFPIVKSVSPHSVWAHINWQGKISSCHA